MKTELTITGHIPSKKNSQRKMMRGNRLLILPSQAYETWEREHLRELLSLQYPTLTPPYRIEAVFYPETKRKNDLTNKIESINDLLVKAGVLTDDNWFELTEVVLKFGCVDKKNPRTEITIISADAQENAV